MKRAPGLLLVGLLSCAPAATFAQVPGEPLRQLGVFEGTGRACGGLLKITPRRMSWNTPFSPCPASAYTLLERRQKDGATQWAYRFTGAPKRCLYKVVVLEKKPVADSRATPWNAYGFVSTKAYRADSSIDRLSCYLIKAD